MIPRFSSFLLLLLTLCSSRAHAQATIGDQQLLAGHALFHTYGPEQGLPSVHILALLQDVTGFIWIGTESGLYRYDGSRFQYFGLHEGLHSSSISRLFEDRSGTLWVGTPAGLHRWNGHTFVHDSQGLADASIISLADGPGGLWVVISQARGPRARSAAGSFAEVPGWPGGDATAVANATDLSSIWVGQWDGHAAHVLRWRNGVWEQIQVPVDDAGERVEKLIVDAEGRLWARHASGLWMKPRDGIFEKVVAPTPIHSQAGFLVAGNHGDIWVPTDSGLLHHDGDRWEHIDGPANVPATWCRAVLQDREGSLWWGSIGLHRRLGRDVLRAYTTAEGLKGDVVWSILRDRDRRLWVSTNAGLAELTTTGFRSVRGTDGSDIRTIAQGANGRLLLAGRLGKKLLAYDPASDVVESIPIDSIDAHTRVFRLLQDTQGTIWAATSDGLHSADSRMLWHAIALPQGDAEEFVGDVRQDAQGRIWAAGQFGLAMFEGGNWRRFTTADGLRSNFLSQALPTASGDILIGYFDPMGISQMRYADGQLRAVQHLDSSAGITDAVFAIGEDVRHRFWIGGSQGVDVIGPSHTQHLGLADGLLAEDIANGAFLAEPAGDVWIGTSSGLAHFDGTAFDASPPIVPPNVALMDLQLGKDRPLPEQQGLSVPHDANTFEARLAGLSFAAQRDLQYRIRLAGLEDDFHVSASPTVRYAELPYGHYQLQTSARTAADAAWGAQSTFAFDVLPAWWQTWWFRAFSAMALLACLAGALRWRTNLLQRRNAALTLLVNERTQELSHANDVLRDEVTQRTAAEQALAQASAQERRRAERLTLVANMASIIASNLDVETLVARAEDALREVLEGCNVAIPLIPLADDMVVADNDPVADEPGIQMPIVLGEQRLGTIRVSGDRSFDPLDVTSIEIIADYLAVAIQNSRLFDQARRLAVVDERQRVAHDLHDNVTQILASISMRAQTLARQGQGQSPQVVRHAERLAELAQIAVAEMRAYLEQLRPSAQPESGGSESSLDYLRERSFAEALERLLRSMVPENVRIELDLAHFPAQSFEREEALLRVCQEAVSNAVRHSGAATLRITSSVSTQTVSVSVSDDGRGMPATLGRGGIGQESMRLRLAALGGQLRVSEADPRGTVVVAELPRADRS